MTLTNIDNRLAFIVGHYKSGSTWLAHVLALAPGIVSVRECHVFRYARDRESFAAANQMLFSRSAWGKGGLGLYPRHWASTWTRSVRVQFGLARHVAALPASDVPTSMHDLGLFRHLVLRERMRRAKGEDEYCQLLFSALLERFEPRDFLVEKTPTNIFELGSIKRIFPRAKLISIHRDGRDVVVSDMHHLRRAYGKEQEFGERVRKWVLAMRTELNQAKTFDIHQISYEDMHQNPHSTVGGVLQFLGVENSPVLIDRMVEGASFKASSGGRAAGVEDPSSFHRKGVVGDWRSALTQAEIAEFSEIAGDLLVELGYEQSANWRDWT